MRTPERYRDVEAKLDRADVHLAAVKAAVATGPEDEPDRILGEFDHVAGRYLFRSSRDSRSGPWLSPVIGDCVHNLRSALDFAVWELADSSARGAHTQFPIFERPDGYEQAARRQLRGVPPTAQRVIECLQPFNGPDCRPNFALDHPSDKPLARLQVLDRWDKHRALNLVEELASYEFVGLRELDVMVPRVPSRHLTRGFRSGDVMMTLELPDFPDAMIGIEVSYGLSFAPDGPVPLEPVVETLEAIRDEVRGRVVPALARFARA